MNKKYRVVFLSLFHQKEDFQRSMSKLGIATDIVDEMIQKAPVILKRDLTLADARHYADALQLAGGKVQIQDDGLLEEAERIGKPIIIEPLENFIMCPECGYKQLKGERCAKCSFLLNSVELPSAHP